MARWDGNSLSVCWVRKKLGESEVTARPQLKAERRPLRNQPMSGGLPATPSGVGPTARRPLHHFTPQADHHHPSLFALPLLS